MKMFSLLGKREIQGVPAQGMIKASTGLYFLQRMKLDRKLSVHNGCVNTICWNEKGMLILSGSDDQHLAITDPFSGKTITKFRSGHRSNIFSAKFMALSSDREVVSCSGSGEIFYTDIEREDTYGSNRFDCHFGSTYKLLVVPNEAATFLSCGDDGTVRFFDLRKKTSCSKFNCEEDVLILLRNSVTSMAIDPVIPYQLAVASSDGIVRLYDRRMLKAQNSHAMNESLIFKFPPPMLAMSQGRQRYYRITSLNYRPGSHDLLVNYSSENIYLFNTYDIRQQMSYTASPAASQSKPGIKVTSPAPETTAATSSGRAGPATTSGEAAVSNVSSPSDPGSDSDSSSFKAIKRLRLRGDWSDTGPDARPEGEEPAQNIMQRMSDLLTRMLNSPEQSEAAEQGQETENNDTREETLGQPTDQAEMPRTQQEPDSLDQNRPVGSEETAAMMPSVTFGSSSSRGAGSRAERDATRLSISSEGNVSIDLSPQDSESSAHPLVGTVPQKSSADGSTETTLEARVQGNEHFQTYQTQSEPASKSRGEGQSSDTQAQTSLNDELLNDPDQAGLVATHSHTVHTCKSDDSIHENRNSPCGLDGQWENSSYKNQETSNSLSEKTETTVISVINKAGTDAIKIRSDIGLNEDNSLVGTEEMEVDNKCQDRCEDSLKGLYEGMDFSADKSELGSSDSSCESNASVSDKMAASLQITSLVSRPAEKTSSVTGAGSQSDSLSNIPKCLQTSELRSQEVEKLMQKSSPNSSSKHEDPLAAAETSSQQVPSDPLCSVPSSDSFSMASLWSSSSSAATVAVAEGWMSCYEGSNSQQTLQNVSTLSSLSSPVCSITETAVQDVSLCAQADHISDAPRQPASASDKDILPRSESFRGSEDVSLAEASSILLNQAIEVKTSSGPHTPCKPCCHPQTSGGKGKGSGKSSNRQNLTRDPPATSHPSQFSPYNSGKMRISSDAPPTSDEAGPSDLASGPGAATCSSSPASGSSSSERRKRHGVSLPPTGKFQLYGSDDEDDDEGDRRQAPRKPDKERMSKAAQKIQEAFRQRREEREFARIKEAPQPKVFMKFSGHRNCRTVIKEANFYGDDYVMSGSDCGRIMFWERETGRLVMYLDADKHVVNCVQPNPYAPVLASSGIDYDVKIWSPLEQDSQFDGVKSEEIINRNERMLEVTRDTITVPAAFMLRILASLSQIRNGRGSSRQQPSSSNQD